MSRRFNYWCCSKFADKIRGTCKPYAESSKGWDNWHKAAKAKYPVRYWIAEEGLDLIQDIIHYPTDKLYNVKCYLKNRFIDHSHALTSTTLKRGQWCDLGYRIEQCLFEELVEFVEVEKAWMKVVWDDDDSEIKKKYPRKWYNLNWRSPEAGLAYLNWEMSLVNDKDHGYSPTDIDFGKPTRQAENAKEIYALYYWWKNVRPLRKDPHDESGWSDYCDQKRAENNGDSLGFLDHGERSEEETAEVHKMLNKCTDIEEAQFDEDTQMLTRLIKVRRSLST